VIRRCAAAALAVALAAACGSVTRLGGGPSPSPTPAAVADLRYALISGVGPPWYCSADEYPVARPVPDAEVRARLDAERARDPDTYEAILRHHGLSEDALTPTDRRTVYRDVQDLAAVPLVPDGARYRFDYTVRAAAGSSPGTRVTGTIDAAARISVESRTPRTVACPICLALGTEIATPAGPVAVERLRPGALVWSRDAPGARVAEPVVAAGHTPVPAGHEVVRLALADGRWVRVSPGHPAVDGRPVGELRAGDAYDGSVVTGAAREPYAGRATYDLLPAGPTGVYWAGGIPLRSTLRPPA
jgi:hypothetical protein